MKFQRKLLLYIAILFLSASEISGQWLQQPFPFSDALNMVRFADSTTGWIVGWGNIYKTTDGGNSWITQDSSGGTALEVLNDKTVFYSNYSLGIRKTTDGGLTWNTLDKTTIYCTEIQFLNDFTGYICGSFKENSNPILKKTTDGGRTWNTVWADTTDYEIQGLSFVDPLHGWIVLYNAVIMKTTDGGASWDKERYNLFRERKLAPPSEYFFYYS